MTKDLISSVIYLNTAHAVWMDLKNFFSKGNGPRVLELRRMVSTLSQDNLSMSSYYTKFKIIWDELVDYKTIPSCSCGVCTCGSMASQAEYQEEECTMNFLMGLSDSFSSIRGHILLMQPLPSLNNVFSLVIQEEKQRRVGTNPVVEFAALLSRGSNASNKGNNYSNKFNGKKERPICSHCGIVGHVMDK